MNRIRIEKSIGKNALKEIREDWTDLFAKTNCALFLSWEWISAWHEKLAPKRSIYLLKAYRNAELVGILPLGLQTKKVLGMRFSQLGFLGEEIGGADYLDLIASEENKAEIWREIFEFLRKEKDYDSINLETVAQNSATVSILESLCESNSEFTLKTKLSSVCPQIELENGWEQILLESKRKDNFKRRLKKLEKMKGFEFRSVINKNEISEAFERFVFLHEKRWENNGGSEATGLPQLMKFHRLAVKELAEKQLVRFDEIWVEGACRASVYGLDDGKTFNYYNAGYDLDFAKHSVGLVLIGLSIKSAVERGNRLYDFLRGEENYKFDWSNLCINTINIQLSRPDFRVFLNSALNDFSSFMRMTAKTLLPDQMAEKLQTMRRVRLRNRKAS